MTKEDGLVKGYISSVGEQKAEGLLLDPSKHSMILNQAFKSEVSDKTVIFPKELGVEHPFDFSQVGKYVNGVGLVDAFVTKIVNSIVGDFLINLEDDSFQEIVDKFTEDSEFITHIISWVKEGVSKGNSYLDLTDMLNNNLSVINADDMYVVRDKHKKILGYNQYIGPKNRMSFTKSNIIPFKPNQIAHLKINCPAGSAYGNGYIWSNLRTIDGFASSELDRHKLMTRKAGAPLHVAVGIPGESVQRGDIDEFKTSLQYLNNSFNYVTDANIKMEVIDFKDLGKNLTDATDKDVELLAMGMNIPLSLTGKGNMPEGLAKSDSEMFQRFINSIRINIEDIIEEQVIKPLLGDIEGIKIEFTWALPGEEEKNLRLTTIQTAMSSALISPELRASLEIEYAKVLGLDDVIELLPTPEESRKMADEKANQDQANIEKQMDTKKFPQSITPVNEIKTGQVDGDPILTPKTVGADDGRTIEETDQSSLLDLPVKDYVNLAEIRGFTYTDYLVKVLQALKIDKFTELLAENEQQLLEGLLPSTDIEKLRLVLKDGFQENKTIREITKDIKENIDLKDRKKLEEGELKLTVPKENRPELIARTETVRLANEGLKDLYLKHDLEMYKYLAALDERTCPICMSLDGQAFKLNEARAGTNMPPMHVNCRCTMVGLL